MENHIDMLIFHTAICAEASQICHRKNASEWGISVEV